jgi:TolA-binding protein
MESQDSAAAFFFKLWPQIEANKNRIVTGVIVIAAAVAIYSFYSWRHETNQNDAGDELTQALLTLPSQTDPAQIARSYLAVAEEYPGTPAGNRSLLEGATVLFTQGKYSDAQTYFQQFLDAHPDDEFSAQAALGMAKCLEAQGDDSKAQGAYQHVINDFADPQCRSEAQFALAQLDMQDKNYADAVRLFQQVAQPDPYGPLGQEAAQYAYELRSKVPAQPSVMPSTTPSSSFNLSH